MSLQLTFLKNNIVVDYRPGLSHSDLIKIIANYDGLAVRSSTQVSKDVIESGTNLKIIGRAGIGTDNIDKKVATEKGVIVMNTPFGNAVTTAEHTIAMMMSLVRMIPIADKSTKEGKWESQNSTELKSQIKCLVLLDVEILVKL